MRLSLSKACVQEARAADRVGLAIALAEAAMIPALFTDTTAMVGNVHRCACPKTLGTHTRQFASSAHPPFAEGLRMWTGDGANRVFCCGTAFRSCDTALGLLLSRVSDDGDHDGPALWLAHRLLDTCARSARGTAAIAVHLCALLGANPLVAEQHEDVLLRLLTFTAPELDGGAEPKVRKKFDRGRQFLKLW